MVIANRIAFLCEQIANGRQAALHITVNPASQKLKVKVLLQPDDRRHPSGMQSCLADILDVISQNFDGKVVVDRGHKFSNGVCETCFWASYPDPSAVVRPVGGTSHVGLPRAISAASRGSSVLLDVSRQGARVPWQASREAAPRQAAREVAPLKSCLKKVVPGQVEQAEKVEQAREAELSVQQKYAAMAASSCTTQPAAPLSQPSDADTDELLEHTAKILELAEELDAEVSHLTGQQVVLAQHKKQLTDDDVDRMRSFVNPYVQSTGKDTQQQWMSVRDVPAEVLLLACSL
eukprot:TRINITY_DN18829_c0_g1_i1.p1 TRINITY_DN18829_c0_g1~~TRINITY_DN18829_c0_g1_i1.p1  ORF type:complete len:291 (-),score=39.54 TRINITY_DN18829_c0_g1_i1:419-1291(-)